MTVEQAAVVDAASQGCNLVIEAGAGTGKTTTLLMLADHLKGRGIYVAFNRQIVDEAQRRFGSDVACYTAHQLAYESVGHLYSTRLHGRRMRYVEVAGQLGLKGPVRLSDQTPLTRFQLIRHAYATVRSYCRSADDTLRLGHVPRVIGIDGASESELKFVVLGVAIQLWEDLIDPGGRFPFIHDHYLKMWSLGNPVLDCDYLMFDEAQDADPLTASIVQGQSCQKIAVGDPHQAIYGWRGAIDALATWPADTRLQLTQSWRFGPAIAAEANKWLATLNATMQLTGDPSIASTVGPNPDAQTVLCRTNAECISEVTAAMQQGRSVALVGGGEAMIRLARASLELKHSGATDHPELFAFKSWREVQDFSFQDDGVDLRTFVKIVDEVGAESLIAAAENLRDEGSAEVIVSTCHKTKGREWPAVRLARDFHRPAVQTDGTRTAVSRDEAMLAYVAVTRAKTSLDCSTLAWYRNINTPS